ncbi:MAG: heterodisulfide reductase-related iron-sulfur binding cluster [Acidiferrobacterales bacterium]
MAPVKEQERREGSLEAPERRPLAWQNGDFYDESCLSKELERIFDICHGCRRCFSLCNAFPTLFDLIDESETMELDGVHTRDYWKVVDHCYLCDMCFMTKCPYVPPHPWAVDFPKLMLRAKAVKLQAGSVKFRDKTLTATDTVGRLAGIPVIVHAVNAANGNKAIRKLMHRALGVHSDASVPKYHSRTLRRRADKLLDTTIRGEAAGQTHGRVVLFATCYGNYNEPQLGEDLIAVFQHNGIEVRFAEKERCCGMPKLELGDLEAVKRARDINVPVLAKLVDEGWDIVAPVPSCVLMFKQEIPLMFPDDEDVVKVRHATYDPFEYLMFRHREGKLKLDFKAALGRIAYHVPCHLRVQNIGLKTRDVLELIPETEVEVIERCSGHDGTYAVKSEYHDTAMKIGRPTMNRVERSGADHYSSDCPMAGHQIEHGIKRAKPPVHPLALLRKAYGI